MMNISFETSLKKGDLGERLVAHELGNRGYFTTNWDQSGGHPFDKTIVERKSGKIVALADVKTKPIRNKYQDTGIDLSAYHHYRSVSKVNNLPFMLFFVDEVRREIYFNSLHQLCIERLCDKQKYPKTELFHDKIIYFHISTLNFLCSISTGISHSIKDQNQRSYPYTDNNTYTSSLFAKRIAEQSDEWLKSLSWEGPQK